MKRKLLITTILLFMSVLLLPTSLAVWEGLVDEITTVQSIQFAIGNFKFGQPESDFKYDRNKVYKNYDVVEMDGRYFVITKIQACGNAVNYDQNFHKCNEPDTYTDGYYKPFTEITPYWKSNTVYPIGDFVIDGNNIFKSIDNGNLNLKPSEGNTRNAWHILSYIEFTSKYYSMSGDYRIENDMILLLKEQLMPGGNASIPEYAIGMTFKDNYISSKKYNKGDAVFHNGGVYVVRDKALANLHSPGEKQGAWQRIDNGNWQSYNVYDKGAAVFYDGKLFKADRNDVRVAPQSEPDAWSEVRQIQYQSFNTYDKNDVVIYGQRSYRALKKNSNVIPGAIGSESSWMVQQ